MLTSCDDYEVKTAFELFHSDLHIDRSYSSTATQVRSCLFNLNKLFHKNNLKKLERNLPKSEMPSLRYLAKNNNLIIIKLEKGNCVDILNKNDCITKSLNILSDYTKFRIFNNDTLDTNENKLNHSLRKLLKQGHITTDLYNELFASGLRPGFYYGLPKIYKANASLRPI